MEASEIPHRRSTVFPFVFEDRDESLRSLYEKNLSLTRSDADTISGEWESGPQTDISKRSEQAEELFEPGFSKRLTRLLALVMTC